MKIPRHIKEYSDRYTVNDRPLVSSPLGGVEQAVVIPALAERDSLLATLSSLSRNCERELGRTLIICVINNRRKGIAAPEDIGDNQETLRCLHALIDGLPYELSGDGELAGRWQELSHASLRLAYLDASSPGREMPDRQGGVGTARKIGMDAALTVFDYNEKGEKLLISLDADTLVGDNYLEAIRGFFVQKQAAAVVNFSHQRPREARERVAIYTYELFLRYYVLGLRYAGSPYAFHTIGSTMVCTADAYAAVGGMNRRDGAEDFYFLNKMAKYRGVGRISDTTVYPSARPSGRVPFGTGRRMMKFLEGGRDEFLFYDPRVFSVLKRWLEIMRAHPDGKTAEIMTLAKEIDPLLFVFLENNDFPVTWERIRKNAGRRDGLVRHFHYWFDGFKTMKLIRFLTDRGFPQISTFRAIEAFLDYLPQDSCLTRSTDTRESCKTLSATLPNVSFFNPV